TATTGVRVTPQSEEPPLAGCAGRYREYRPPVSLRRHFTCLWTNAVPGGRDALTVAVVPDGCVDLLWIDGRLVVAGPDRVAAMATLAPGAVVLGARFRPAAAGRWLRLPMSEIVDRRVALEDLAAGLARTLVAPVADAGTPPRQMRRLAEG